MLLVLALTVQPSCPLAGVYKRALPRTYRTIPDDVIIRDPLGKRWFPVLYLYADPFVGYRGSATRGVGAPHKLL